MNNVEVQKQWPETMEEAVDRILLVLNEPDKERIRNTPKALEMIAYYHDNLGMWIRNEFGLWGINDKLLQSCGVNRDKDHAYPTYPYADYVSADILGAVWQALHRETGGSDRGTRPVKYLSSIELIMNEIQQPQESKPGIDEATRDH